MFSLLLKKKSRLNEVLRNRAVPVIHASVPHFPGIRALLASDICDWIDHA